MRPLGGLLGAAAVLLGLLCACGSGLPADVSAAGRSITPNVLVAHAMLQEARAGRFQAAPPGYHYAAPVECRVDSPHGFHGSAIYLCKIAIAKLKDTHLYEWGAWYRGALHTHNTDPGLIKTITGPFDPPFSP